ncbi:MAG: photosystem II reaction center protein PsbZ [Gloeomargarita sp. SKYBB_i_bin120]|nr:photosystem II reaction center protein PsbZ [Gloeomargarita sp. SKYB120]MDW8178447.1 photosystem II reaction center protein PsbZ [Gloeomargarita sp. SKYBB_i_bin120]
MTIVFQALVLLLVLLTFVLVVAVPVVLATPGEWQRYQRLVYLGAGVWVLLIFTIGLMDVFLV